MALALVAFVALTVFGLGMTSLVTSSDVIAAPGFGPLPGVLGVALAAASLGAVLGPALRARHPSFLAALWAAVSAYVAYLVGVWITAALQGVDLAAATAAVGRLAIGWWAPIVAAAAAVCAWAGVALVRTRAHRPRWPWERDDDE